MTTRQTTFQLAIREALDLCMSEDPSIYVMGLGVPDPKGIFGTTIGLQKKFGEARVMDMPTSENGMTGVAIGSALVGMRPVMTHQRVDFALLAIEQIANQAAKWHYMFGGKMKVPLVIRLVIGRGWGQGPQHSQIFHGLFAHVPGLRVVAPATAHDAKGLLMTSLNEDNPVIFMEHRWLHATTGLVPEGKYYVPFGKARIAKEGKDLTIVAFSYMTLEAIKAADQLAAEGIDAEVIDLRSISPLDDDAILSSVKKTGHLMVVDMDWKNGGFGAEIVARVTEQAFTSLKAPTVRIAFPDCPTPTSPALSAHYYPRAAHLVREALTMFGKDNTHISLEAPMFSLDVPNKSFKGPF